MTSAQPKKLISSSKDAATRLIKDRAEVTRSVASQDVHLHLERVAHPKSMSGAMKKAGIALIAAPDPITGVGGVALVATAFAMKKREPVGIDHLAKETRKVLRDLESLRI